MRVLESMDEHLGRTNSNSNPWGHLVPVTTHHTPGHTVILMQHFAVIAGNTVMQQCCDAYMMHDDGDPVMPIVL
jgi:hypothetical protein